jgi:hypothetical protein
MGLFPVINLEESIGRRYFEVNLFDDDDKDISSYNEQLVRASVLLPLNFSRGIYNTSLNLEGGVSYSYLNFLDTIPLYMQEKMIMKGIDLSGFFTHVKAQSKRQYYPQWGLDALVFYRYAGFNGKEGTLNSFSVNSTFYLPGLLNTHSLRIMPAYEKRSTDQAYGVYWLSNQLLFTRGYNSEPYKEFYKLTSVYSMPLLYPDLSLGRVLYCNRIRGDIFYDYGYTKSGPGESKNYQSAGVELNFELYFASIPAPIETGVRISQRFNDNKYTIEFVLAGVVM